MSEPLVISRQRATLHDRYQLVEDRARNEPIVELNFQARKEAAEKAFQETTLRLITGFEAEKNAAQAEFESTQQRVGARFEQERAAQDKEVQDARKRITRQAEDALHQAQ